MGGWDFGLDSDDVTSEIRSAVDAVPDLPEDVDTEVLAISTDDTSRSRCWPCPPTPRSR